MAFDWDEQDNNDVFRDIPDEVNEGQSAPMPVINSGNVRPQHQPTSTAKSLVPLKDLSDDEFLESIMEEAVEEEDYTSVLADANLRIDLASLYKLIMNHDFFDGMDVDQRAIDTVHKEVRRFARERMEIMLGMRQEQAKETIVNSPFNDLEVDILKKLASAASKGATQSPEANKTAQVMKQPRKEGLNTIGSKPSSKPSQIITKKPITTAIVSKTQPVQRQPKSSPVVSEAEYKPIGKPIHELTEQEIIQRNKEASDRQAGRKPAKSSTSIPMPTADQEEMYQTQRVMMSDHPLGSPNAVSAIVAALNKSKSQ